MRFQNILSKASIVLAVVLVLCLTCITAFAAETYPAFDGTVAGDHSFRVSVNNQYTWDMYEGYTYTLTAAEGWSVSYDDGTTWTPITSEVQGEYVYTATADGRMRISGSYNSYDVVVNVAPPAPLSDLLEDVQDFSTGLFGVGGQFITFITTPANIIVLLPLALFLLVALLGGIKRLISGV